VTLVRSKAAEKAPYKTGALRWSIVEKVDGLVGTVWTNLKYAAIHEYGWIITPKKWKYLVFQKGGKTIFAKKVRIPKRPYLRPALADSQSKIREYFAKALDLFIN
jgi:phage gpG-like protein